MKVLLSYHVYWYLCVVILYKIFFWINSWFLQLLAVTAPTVLFHFAASYFSGEIQKLRVSENQLKMLEDGALHSIRVIFFCLI